ncbi:MAG TPA: hypothetical protein VK876_03575, partial [Rubrivivax sp.]|nr:hypothetical protein [Rubrivivax sp.]
MAVSTALLLCFGLAWLSIAWSWVLAAPASGSTRAVRVAILALAFLAPAMMSRLRATARPSPWRPWLALLLAAVPVVLALAWPGGIDKAPMPDTAADPDDPYLTPSWR